MPIGPSTAAGSGVPLGILPTGTGNLLARNLGLPIGSGVRDLASIAITGRSRRIDVGWVEADGPSLEQTAAIARIAPDSHAFAGSTPFLVIAGMGFDAAVMHSAGRGLKRTMGWGAYVVSGLRYLRRRRVKAHIVAGEGHNEFDLEARAILFANCGRLPGGFVLAPEYDEIIVDDTSTASPYLDATLNLIRALIQAHPIDDKRLYTTGQSGGGMMSIAMNIKYPDFFAASYLVACQWNPELLTPAMKDLKWWITVSEDDSKAYPGEIAITDKLAGFGAKIARAQWNAQWTADEYQKAFAQMDAEHANINFVHFAKGSVFKTAAEANAGGASGHNATWKYAYNITPIREWIFRQQKA